MESTLLKSIVPSAALFVMAMGVAACAGADEGQWQPCRLPAEIRFARDVDYPARVASITADLSVIAASTMRNPDYGVRYASVAKSLNSTLKKTQGLLDGFARKDAAAFKDMQDAAFRAWYKAHAQQSRAQLDDLDAAIAADMATTRLETAWLEATHSELLDSARTLVRLALERQKPDAQREAGYQERDLPFIKARLSRLEQSFAPSVDAARWQAGLVRYSKIDPKLRPPGLDALLPAPNALTAMYGATELADTNKRLAWIGSDLDALRKSGDPFIALALRLQDVSEALEGRRKEVDGNLVRVIPRTLPASCARQ
jgi:hypothetical protein